MSERAAVSRATGWRIALAEGLAAGAAAFWLTLALAAFERATWPVPLAFAGAAAALCGDGPLRRVLRRIVYLPLLALGGAAVVFAVLLKPWIALIGLAGGVLFFVTAPSTRRTRRVVLLAVALSAMTFALVATFVMQSAAIWLLALPVLILVLIVVLTLRRPEATPRLAAWLALIFAFCSIPVIATRFLPTGERGKGAVLVQPGVELIFDNKTSIDFPANRAEILCDSTTGVRVVTPHFPSSRVAILAPAQPITSVVLAGEASEQSVVRDGVLYTAARGAINTLDLRSLASKQGPRLASRNFSRLHFAVDSGLLFGVEDQGDYCHLARRDTLAGAGHLPMATPGVCLPLGDGRVLISEPGWPGRRLTLRRLSDGVVLVECRLMDIGFLDVTIDPAHQRIYAPATLLGIVYVLDLETLRRLTWFRDEPGVRGALVDASGRRLFTFTFYGRVIEHELPSGRIVRAWNLGHPLRGLTWDCDGRSLLAATGLGGFRLRP
jgi:hypothetical protein